MFRFGRNRFDEPGAEFWKWWPGARDGIAKAIVTGGVRRPDRQRHQQARPARAPTDGVGAAARGAGGPRVLPVVRGQPGAAPGGAALARTRTATGCDVGVPRLEAAREDVDDADGRRRPGSTSRRCARARRGTRRGGCVDVRLWHPRFAEVPQAVRHPGGLPVPGPPARRGRRRALDRRDRAVRGADRRANPGRAQGRGRAARSRARGRRHMGHRRGHAARRSRRN